MSVVKQLLLWLMGPAYVFAGFMHFYRPDFYMPMMPPYIPWHAAMVFLSGVAEVVLGIAVVIPTTRKLAGWGLIALLIAILPANIHIAVHNIPVFGASAGPGVLGWVRVPFQGVLIAGGWWDTRV